MAAKRLKVFQAHLGFYDTVVAAPSQKAALLAWGAGRNEFANGFAKVASDPGAIKVALAHPGQVLKRPFCSKGEYKIEADPVPAPKVSAKQRSAAEGKRLRLKSKNDARRNAERELRDARREELRALAELKAREQELAREKMALRDSMKRRIARARSRIADSK